MVYQALASASGGNMWNKSAQPRKMWITHFGQFMRCSDHAASVAVNRQIMVLATPTIIELR